MIQACSRCGTRWNVRDRRREICPRCGGALLAPVAAAPAVGQQPNRPALRPPAGYRWIAVRPGAAPRPKRRDQEPGPTPRYSYTPRWGLNQEFAAPVVEVDQAQAGPSTKMVQASTVVAMSALGAAAVLHIVRYVMLLINRTVLLNPWVAAAGTWLAVAASVVAAFAVVTVALVLTNWLITRRATAYERVGGIEPRPRWWLWLATLVPVLNLFWTPVFVMELATTEKRLRALRRPIITWWVIWAVATLIAGWSIATSFTTDPQGIADNTITTILAYLAGMAALRYVHRVYLAFEGSTAEQPGRRWVVADVAAQPAPDDAVPVEGNDEEPAA